jgi:hypothetical protein
MTSTRKKSSAMPARTELRRWRLPVVFLEREKGRVRSRRGCSVKQRLRWLGWACRREVVGVDEASPTSRMATGRRRRLAGLQEACLEFLGRAPTAPGCLRGRCRGRPRRALSTATKVTPIWGCAEVQGSTRGTAEDRSRARTSMHSVWDAGGVGGELHVTTAEVVVDGVPGKRGTGLCAT